MMDMGYPLHLIDLLAKLYRRQLAKVKVAGTLSEWFLFKKGVRQGCDLSQYLFNILAELVMRDTLDGFRGVLQIGHMTRHVRQLFKVKRSKVKVTRSGDVSADKNAITRQSMVISIQTWWELSSCMSTVWYTFWVSRLNKPEVEIWRIFSI